MRYFYKNKDNDFYNPQLVNNPAFWLWCSLAVMVVFSWLYSKGFKGWIITYTLGVSLILFLGVLLVEIVDAGKHLGSVKRIPSYLICWLIYAGKIDTDLLNSRSKASMTNHSYRVLPKVWIYKEDKNLYIKLEKLAGTYEEDLPKLAELISSAIGENWRVTSKIVEDNESWFRFVLSPVNRQLLFTPKDIRDLQQPLYKVKLQKNWILDFSRAPHLSCFGKTDSGKSTVLWSIILQTISNSDLFFEDFKHEYSIMNDFYPEDHFATSTDQIIDMFEKLVNEMDRRKEIVTKEAQRRGVIGLTAFDLKMKPIYIFVDEWASVMSSFSTDSIGRKKKKHCEALLNQLLSQARAYAMIVIYANQSPSTEILSQKDRSQFGNYILLGSANQDTQRMVFDEVVTRGSVAKFSGYYLENTAGMEEPQRFYVPDVFKNHLNSVKVLKEIYQKGNVK